MAVSCLAWALCGCGALVLQSASGALRLSISASTLDFGSVTVNGTSTRALTLTSAGPSAVTVNSVALQGTEFTMSGATFPVTLSPGQSVTLQVAFNPPVAGAAAGSVTISSDASSDVATVNLTGMGTAAPAPQMTLSVSSLAFGNVAVDTTSTKALTLTSSGTAPLTVNAVKVQGTGFAISGATFPATLNPGQSVALQVSFDPAATGAADGTISIVSNASSPGKVPAIVSLSGTGITSPIPQLTLSAGSLDFGSVTVKTTSTKTLTLTSSGSSSLTVNSVRVQGTGFAVSGAMFPSTLTPGQSVTLQVSFDPSTTGAATGTITVSSDSSTGATSMVALSGTATAVLTPTLTLSTSSLAFGSVTVNSTSTKLLTLTSSGTAALKINSVILAGTGFSMTGGTFPATLNPGQSVTLQVSFDPTVTGTASGTITVSSDSSTGATSMVALGGTATTAPTPRLTLSAGTLAFGSVTINSTSTKSLTLTSSGTAALKINSVILAGTGFSMTGATFPATLNAGQSLTLQVSFDPSVTGAATGTITISSNSSMGATSMVALRGIGTAAPTPQLTVSADTLAFGNVTLSTTSTKTLTLTSSGTAALKVNSMALQGAGFALSGGTFPATLNPGQSVNIQVSFDPTIAGAASGTITISSNASSDNTTTVTLSGTGTSAQLTFSAGTLAFGNVMVKTTSTKTLMLTSSGTAALTVNSVTLQGAGFAISGASFPATLNPGQSATVQVSFDPTATGTASGTITISSNSSTSTTSTVSLSGTGTSPQLTLSAGSLAFGNETVNTTSTKTLILTSSGTAALTVNSVTLQGTGFAISGGTFPATLNPGQSATVQVSFDPTVTGSASGTITISSNSSSGSTSTVALSGSGTAATTPQLTLSASTLAFGSVTLNTTSTKTLTLTSSGTAALQVNSVTLQGTGFAVSGATFPATLNLGQSVTLQVVFDPTVAGATSGTITISSDSSSGSTVAVILSGTGTSPANPVMTLSTTTLSFGNDTVGTAVSLPVTLTSTGTSPVTVSAASLTGAGFTFSGASFPVTLNPTIAITIQVQFDPAAVGAASGTLTFASNSITGTKNVVNLNGTGTAPVQHKVSLNWTAPLSSPVAVSGYNIYRATGSSTSYQLLNSSVNVQTTYVDLAVATSTTYSYYVTSVDSAGAESGPSNEVSATVP